MNTTQFFVVMVRAKVQVEAASAKALLTAEQLLQGHPEASQAIRCYRIAFGIHATLPEMQGAEIRLITQQLGRDVSRKPARNCQYLAWFCGQAGVPPCRGIVTRRSVADPRDTSPRVTHIRMIPVDRLRREAILRHVHHDG